MKLSFSIEHAIRANDKLEMVSIHRINCFLHQPMIKKNTHWYPHLSISHSFYVLDVVDIVDVELQIVFACLPSNIAGFNRHILSLCSIFILFLIYECDIENQSKIQIAKRHRKHYSFLRTCAPLLFIFSVFLLISLMYWLYFDLREQLSDHRSKIEQGECKQTFSY